MKIWLLELTDEDLRDYDCVWGMVVMGSSETQARNIPHTQKACGEECRYPRSDSGKVIGEKVCPWRDPAMSSCKEIGSNELDGLPRVILSDTHHG